MLKQTLIAVTLAFSAGGFAAEHWIDVRVPEQYQQEHVEGAVNIPLRDIQAGTFTPLPKDDTLYLYCNSGRQSTLATETLSRMGYQHVINLGGINQVDKPRVRAN
ncbi:thiosulfate sulfurtransferase PspE [Metakosakonia massiliensis]|uniref:Thiosulfate sulfurtransferase PspE n=1 Tax=Phytobacter massiliensis TaxID=1485952 RepID=A0A6N3HTT2_9ENTR|nr:thiosulfate sulfurtransferase PspE [Phytobacter massiliensis]